VNASYKEKNLGNNLYKWVQESFYDYEAVFELLTGVLRCLTFCKCTLMLNKIEPELLPIEVLHSEKMDFRRFCSCDLDLDLDLMTFIYELDPYSLEIYRMCNSANMNLLRQVKAFES